MSQNRKEFEYYAFISYKREDEKWAKWLQKKLESYGFSVALRKNNPYLPAKIRPVFRDQSELAGGNLKAEIEKGLENSKFLIVICSPHSANSQWVDKEVNYFIENGRENNIIPFIIDGTPNAKNPEEECFPEALRRLSGEKELLGINIKEMGRDAAAIKVIARMFDLRFDKLWQRHKRLKRRKRIAIVTSVLLLALAGVVIGSWMLKKQSLAISNHIIELISSGDGYAARREAINLVDYYPLSSKAYQAVNAANRANTAIIQGFDGYPLKVAVSPDEKYIAVYVWNEKGDDFFGSGAINVYDAGNGELLNTYKCPLASSINFFDDSSLTIVGDGVTILNILDGTTTEVIDKNLSLEGVAAVDSTVAMHSTSIFSLSSNSTEVSPFSKGPHRVKGLSHDKDLTKISIAVDSAVFLLNNKGDILKSVPTHGKDVFATAVSPSGVLWAYSIGDSVYIDNIAYNKRIGFTTKYEIEKLLFDEYGKLYGIDKTPGNPTVYMWDRRGNLLKTFDAHNGSVEDISISGDGTALYSVSRDRTLRKWVIRPALKSLELDDCFSFAIAPDNQIYWLKKDQKTIVVTDYEGKQLKEVNIPGDYIYYITVNHNGTMMASLSNDALINFWNLPDMTPAGSIWLWDNGIFDEFLSLIRRPFAFSPVTNDLLTQHGLLIDGNSAKIRHHFETKMMDGVRPQTFTSNGKNIALFNSSKIQIFNVDDYSLVREFDTPATTSYINIMVFSPDNNYIALAIRGNRLAVMNALNGEVVADITFGSSVEDVFYFDDGRKLLAMSEDGISIFDTSDWTKIDELDLSEFHANKIGLLNNGESLLINFMNHYPVIEPLLTPKQIADKFREDFKK